MCIGCHYIFNVNGLQNKLDLGVLEQLAGNYEIVCLSEAKTDNPDLSGTKLDQYGKFVMQKKNRLHKLGGIHGLCILMKNDIFVVLSS